MKKLISLLLALVMVFSLATVAFAAEDEPQEPTKTMSTNPDITVNTYSTTIEKLYTVTGAYTEDLYPSEVLSFSSVASTSNPDGGVVNVNPKDITVSGQDANMLTVELPTFTKAGIYTFTITEDGEDTLGVTYDKTTEIALSVLVIYDWEDADEDGFLLKVNTVGVASVEVPVDDDEVVSVKYDEITNEFDLGSLTITKHIDGNLASEDDEFDIDVTFTVPQGYQVQNDVKYSVAGGDYKVADISDTITITLSAEQSATFVDLPAGINYTVVEKDYTDGDENTVNGGYEAPVYELNEVEVDSVSDTIEKATNDLVEITNRKDTRVDTGVTLDTLPFVLILAVCAGAVVLFVVKRRRSTEF